MHLAIEALRGWPNRSKAGLLLASALFVASVAGARADVVEGLQGAWVLEDTDCTKVFEKVQGQIRFKSRTFASESGFIVSGSKAKGPVGGVCTFSEIEEENDGFSARLSCTDTLVSRDFQMVFRIVDTTHFEHLDSRYPELPPSRHKKCAF
jgi:hypothetical protein